MGTPALPGGRVTSPRDDVTPRGFPDRVSPNRDPATACRRDPRRASRGRAESARDPRVQLRGGFGSCDYQDTGVVSPRCFGGEEKGSAPPGGPPAVRLEPSFWPALLPTISRAFKRLASGCHCMPPALPLSAPNPVLGVGQARFPSSRRLCQPDPSPNSTSRTTYSCANPTWLHLSYFPPNPLPSTNSFPSL